jgi:hypothetical protein
MSERPAGRCHQRGEINDGVVRTGTIAEARKDGVGYIHITPDVAEPQYPVLTAKLVDVDTDLRRQNGGLRVGQAVKFQRYIDDSGSKMAFNVVAA